MYLWSLKWGGGDNGGMIFVNWFLILLATTALAVAAGAAMGMWSVRRKRAAIRITVGVFSAPLGLVALLILSLMLLGQLRGSNSYGVPQYSSSRKVAARIERIDEGATGGATNVVLYENHGFKTKNVLSGGGGVLIDSNLEWLDDLHLLIHYPGPIEEISCKSTSDVQVTCGR
jgi:hypothetical protein